MSEPHWATVLRAAYESKGGTVQWVEAVDENHHQRKQEWPFDLREVTNLTNEEIEGAIRFAEQTDQLSQVGSGVHYELTQKGFDVAHERELRKEHQSLTESQNDATDTLADFTIILGVTALVQALAAVVSVPRFEIPLALIYGILLVVLWYKGDDWFHGV